MPRKNRPVDRGSGQRGLQKLKSELDESSPHKELPSIVSKDRPPAVEPPRPPQSIAATPRFCYLGRKALGIEDTIRQWLAAFEAKDRGDFIARPTVEPPGLQFLSKRDLTANIRSQRDDAAFRAHSPEGRAAYILKQIADHPDVAMDTADQRIPVKADAVRYFVSGPLNKTEMKQFPPGWSKSAFGLILRDTPHNDLSAIIRQQDLLNAYKNYPTKVGKLSAGRRYVNLQLIEVVGPYTPSTYATINDGIAEELKPLHPTELILGQLGLVMADVAPAATT